MTSTEEDSDKGIIEHIADGAVPGAFVGLLIGSSRSYLQSRVAAEKSAAAIASAMASKTPPTKAALRALRPQPLPALFATTAAYSALAGVFTGASAMAENIRGKKDVFNDSIGGIITGSLVGLRSGSLYASAGASAALGVGMLCVNLLGGTMGSVGDLAVERRKEVYRS